MIYLFGTIHVIVCLFLIMVVLLQQGKGADLSVFGGGSTMAAFGARSAATLLHKLTVGSFIGFIITTMAIAVLQSSRDSSSVMEGAPVATAPIVPAAPAADATAAPATPSAAAPDATPADAGAQVDASTAPSPAETAPTDAAPPAEVATPADPPANPADNTTP